MKNPSLKQQLEKDENGDMATEVHQALDVVPSEQTVSSTPKSTLIES